MYSLTPKTSQLNQFKQRMRKLRKRYIRERNKYGPDDVKWHTYNAKIELLIELLK